jgi:hypothetical protein
MVHLLGYSRGVNVLSGALLGIPEGFEIERLDSLSWNREERGLELRSVVQLERETLLVERGVPAKKALVIHQDVGNMPEIEERDGRYAITFVGYVRTKYSYIYVLPRLIVVDNLASRKFVRETINKGLRANLAYNITLDTARMARDHRQQWVRKFSGRTGRVDTGTLYGDGVEEDTVFGPELDRSNTKTVGWTSHSFGTLGKVKVSPKGSVTLWQNPPMELFLRFLRREILPYAIALP